MINKSYAPRGFGIHECLCFSEEVKYFPLPHEPADHLEQNGLPKSIDNIGVVYHKKNLEQHNFIR